MNSPLKIVFADDDKDDHFIFAKALEDISIRTSLICINNGEKLMQYLSEQMHQLPDVIFLDLNMPRKNGSECLTEIKNNKNFKHIPFIIYSTSFHTDILDLLYKYGAFYCIRKSTNSVETKRMLKIALNAISEKKHLQPAREDFALGLAESVNG